MAEVNTSIYPQQQQRRSPLETLGALAQTQNAMNQNRLFQQQLNTNLAMGQIYKDAIDPNTGQLDADKLRKLIAQDPNITLALPQAIQQSQANQLQGIQIDNEKLKNIQGHLSSMANLLSSIDPKQGQRSVWQAIGTGIQQKLFTPEQIATELANNPLPDKPEDIEQWRNTYMRRSLDAKDRLQAMYGTPQTLDLGGSVGIVSPTPMTGQLNPMGMLSKSMTPGEAGKIERFTDPVTGQERMTTVGALNQSMSPQETSPGSQQIPGSAFTQQQKLPSIPAGPSATTKTYQQAAGGKIADQEENLNHLVNLESELMFRIDKMRPLLQQFRAGPGADAMHDAARYAHAIGFHDLGDKLARGDLGAMEEFSKLAITGVLEQLQQSLPSGSRLNRQEFEAFQKNLPNIGTDPRAIENMFNIMTQAYKRDNDKLSYWNDWKEKGKDLTQFENAWQKQLQTKGYITPQEKRGFAKGAEKNKENRPSLESIFGQ